MTIRLNIINNFMYAISNYYRQIDEQNNRRIDKHW